MGVLTFSGGHVALDHADIAENYLVGVQVGYGINADGTPSAVVGTVELNDTRIANHPVGVNIQGDDLDAWDRIASVRFDQNQRNLTTDALPLLQPPRR